MIGEIMLVISGALAYIGIELIYNYFFVKNKSTELEEFKRTHEYTRIYTVEDDMIRYDSAIKAAKIHGLSISDVLSIIQYSKTLTLDDKQRFNTELLNAGIRRILEKAELDEKKRIKQYEYEHRAEIAEKKMNDFCDKLASEEETNESK